jgi:hypothetical protein
MTTEWWWIGWGLVLLLFAMLMLAADKLRRDLRHPPRHRLPPQPPPPPLPSSYTDVLVANREIMLRQHREAMERTRERIRQALADSAETVGQTFQNMGEAVEGIGETLGRLADGWSIEIEETTYAPRQLERRECEWCQRVVAHHGNGNPVRHKCRCRLVSLARTADQRDEATECIHSEREPGALWCVFHAERRRRRPWKCEAEGCERGTRETEPLCPEHMTVFAEIKTRQMEGRSAPPRPEQGRRIRVREEE